MSAVPPTPPTLTLSTQAQALITTFNASLTADQKTNFGNALQNSPALITQINTAVAAGELRGFSVLPASTHAGGQFNPASGTMELPGTAMTTLAGGRFDPAELTFVLGHETQHSINRPTVAASTTAFTTEVTRIAATGQATHDYTAPLAAKLAANRNDEASAHIAGFNATVSMVRSSNPTPSLEGIYRASPGRMGDFITVTPGTPASPGTAATPAGYALRAGLTLNADMTMTANVANVGAMGTHYYDQPAASARLGHNGDSNYQNYYATNLVGYVAEVERAYAPTHAAAGLAPRMALDMNALGISEAQVERNGLSLGAAAGRQPYLNTGTTPPTPGLFDHTSASHVHVPVNLPNQMPNVQEPGQAAQTDATGHPAIGKARDALDRSPNISGDAFGDDRLRVAAGIALHSAREGIRPDHVVFNTPQTDLIAVQGNPRDPAALRSTPLPVVDAMNTDLASTRQALDALQPAQDQAQRTLATQQEVHAQASPQLAR